MEKRNTMRVPFHVRSIVKHEDRVLEGDVVNLSTGGMLVNTKQLNPANNRVVGV